ncbi:hypothetical protein OGAPHI_004680 [Ogataea philodendri]|uniref:Zn(2)-C6 fungal-type domain-containing protein n=1 Tax=Ogataea philodendri TaxID=1378263 RepID=A0A9P8T3M6_9ASCO|nr:uncharacterized protein OGAPHI_004680 [Ogataea philodendri]KAH3663966.1 hypothetical protein OGAPHI_004680 [Ogataea philodendri]
MFNAFNVTDLALVDQKPASAARRSLPDFQLMLNTPDNSGRAGRSRSGCNECRRRKLGITCVWRDPDQIRNKNKKRKTNKEIPPETAPESTDQMLIKTPTHFTAVSSPGSPAHSLIDMLKGHVQFIPDVLSPQKSLFSLPMMQSLNQTENEYLDYYVNCVSKTVSILPEETNFFLSLYIPLAAKNTSILHALLGWGGLFLAGSKENSTPLKYIKSSLNLCSDKLKAPFLTDNDKLELVSVYTILCAAEICAGDVKDWYKYFRKLHEFIVDESKGNLRALVQLLGRSEDAKWLISNFLYHDVLSSTSHQTGTIFTSEQYCEALDIGSSSMRLLDSGSVCDPLQGCVRPLYVLLGEIANTRTMLVSMEEELEQITDKEEYDKKRLDYLTLLDLSYKDLDIRIRNTEPHTRSLLFLKNDEELEHHHTLFETYKLSLQIYLRMMIRKTPPALPEIQLLLLELKPCLDIVLNTSVQAALCFPFLVAGCASVTKEDRKEMSGKLHQISSKFPVKNFERILVVIRKVWKNNNGGWKCVYWFDVAESMGWTLSLA